MVTKLGYIHLFALDAGTFIYSTRISSDGIFASAPQVSTGGVVAVSPQGHVFSICINKETIIPFLMNKLDYDLAMAMASKYDFAGGDDLFKTHLSRLLSSGDPEKATTIATNKYLTLQNEIETLKTQNVILQENIEKLEARRILSYSDCSNILSSKKDAEQETQISNLSLQNKAKDDLLRMFKMEMCTMRNITMEELEREIVQSNVLGYM